MSEFWNAARQALPRGQQIGLSQIAELQRRKEAADLLQRQAEQQAFENMFKQKQYDYGVERDKVADQRYAQERQDQNYNNQQDDVYRDTAFRMNLENQLKQNNFEQQRINQSGANNANNLTQAELQAEWFSKLTPEEQDDVRRIQFGLQPKAGTMRQPSPVDPIKRLTYGTDFAKNRMDSDYMRFKDQPNAFDSLRNVGLNEYDSTMAASQPVSQEEESALLQRENDLDQIIATLKAKYGLQ